MVRWLDSTFTSHICGHATLGCYASVHELPTDLVLHRCLRNASCPRPKCPHTHHTHAASASRDLSGLRPGELGELRQFNFNGTHRILAKKRLLQCSRRRSRRPVPPAARGPRRGGHQTQPPEARLCRARCHVCRLSKTAN